MRGPNGNEIAPVTVEMEEGKRFEIEVKRFYVPFAIAYTCPHCGRARPKEKHRDYLSYPTANAIDWQTWECYEEDGEGNNLGCGKEFDLPIFVECRVRAATPEEIAAACDPAPSPVGSATSEGGTT
jgi:hypothetical protein